MIIYRDSVLKNCSSAGKENFLTMGVIGLCEEAGEVGGLVKKHLFQGQELDREKAIKELGDVRWYFEVLCVALGTTIEEVEQKNMEKLARRFPNGFTSEDSKRRRDEDVVLGDLNVTQVFLNLHYTPQPSLAIPQEGRRLLFDEKPIDDQEF